MDPYARSARRFPAAHKRGSSPSPSSCSRPSSKARRFPLKSTCLAIYSLTVNAQKPLEAVLAKHFPWCHEWESELKGLFTAYVEAKQRQNVLDYDDLLLYWAEMMNEPALAAAVADRFDHVLVDEYQDTNRLQAIVLTRLKPDGRGVAVVGDDAQSIYSFRAAEIRNILAFPALFTPAARVIALEKNYRSTQAILDASNAVIALASERYTKELQADRQRGQKPCLVSVPDDTEQVQYVVERVLEARERAVPLKSQAVLFRASHHSAELEIELARRNIPFAKFGGLRFLEAAHVKDVLSVLRLVENPGDRVSGFRVLQLLPGIGARHRRPPSRQRRSVSGVWPGAPRLRSAGCGAGRLARFRGPGRASPFKAVHLAG
jgi:DNA helicase-2/ATP-dependent DNA helicase PcrA